MLADMRHAVQGAIETIEAKMNTEESSANAATASAAAGEGSTAVNAVEAAPTHAMAASSRQDEAALYDALGLAAPLHGQHRFRDAEDAGKAIPSTFESGTTTRDEATRCRFDLSCDADARLSVSSSPLLSSPRPAHEKHASPGRSTMSNYKGRQFGIFNPGQRHRRAKRETEGKAARACCLTPPLLRPFLCVCVCCAGGAQQCKHGKLT